MDGLDALGEFLWVKTFKIWVIFFLEIVLPSLGNFYLILGKKQ